MGYSAAYCNFSKIAISGGQEIVLLPLRKIYDNHYNPILLPIFGKYNDYQGIEDIENNSKYEEILKTNFKCENILQFCNDLVKGNYENLYYCFIDRKVWNFLTEKPFSKIEKYCNREMFIKYTLDKDRIQKVRKLIKFVYSLDISKFYKICLKYNQNYHTFFFNSESEKHLFYYETEECREKEIKEYINHLKNSMEFEFIDEQEIRRKNKKYYPQIGDKSLNIMEDICLNFEEFEEIIVKLYFLNTNTISIASGYFPFSIVTNPHNQDPLRLEYNKIITKFSEINNSYIEQETD